MNPRRVHALMKENFPKVDLAKSTWVNLLESDGSLRGEALVKLMDEFIVAEEVLVEVSRKLGDLVSRDDLVSYVQKSAGQGEIRIADRAFHGYVLIGTNGVATGGHCVGLDAAVSAIIPTR